MGTVNCDACPEGCSIDGKCGSKEKCAEIRHKIYVYFLPGLGALICLVTILVVSCKGGDGHGEGEWSSGLCGCFSDCEICMVGLCCPCIRWGKTLDRAKLWDFHHAAGIMGI